MIEDIITKTLEKLNIPTNIIEKYNEKHRVYHNFSHISNMIKYAIDLNILNDELLIAIIFHDIVYEIGSSTNEEDSVELLKLYYNNTKINNAILSTKNHIPNDRLSKLLCDLDLLPLYSDFRTFKEYDDKIFKEYQRYDYSLYLKSRVDFLRKMEIKKDYIDYVSSRDVKIGLFDGSFNRFHIGHLNILEKAEKIFDKVIIAFGNNKSKEGNRIFDVPDAIKNRQIIIYDGLLSDLLFTLNYDVTLIRGLRNSNDMNYEITQYRYLRDLKPDIKMVNIVCDTEFEHISSSSIRILENYDKHKQYLV